MTLYIFDAQNIAPKRILPGPGIGFVEGGDYLSISITGTYLTGIAPGTYLTGIASYLTGIGQYITGAVQGSGIATQIAIWNSTRTITGSALFVFNGTDVSLTGSLNVSGNIVLPIDGSTIGNPTAGFTFGIAQTDVLGTLSLSDDLSMFGGNFNTFGTDFNFLGGSVTMDNLHVTIGSLAENKMGSAPGTYGFGFTPTRTNVYGPLLFPGLVSGTVAYFAQGGILTGSTRMTFDGNGLNITLPATGSVGPSIILHNTGNQADDQAQIYFRDNNTDRAYINFRVRAGGAGYINFGVGASGAPLKRAELNENGQWQLSQTGSTGGILLGSDGQLYRSANSTLRTPGSLTIDSGLGVNTANVVADGNISLTNYITGTNYYEGTYTPTWTAVTSGTAVGNGTLTGRFQRLGRLCHVHVELDWGTTTNGGFNVWEFTLPIAPSASAARFMPGAALALDAGVNDFNGIARIDNSNDKVRIFYQTGTAASGGRSNFPFIWGNGDTFAFDVSYEV